MAMRLSPNKRFNCFSTVKESERVIVKIINLSLCLLLTGGCYYQNVAAGNYEA
jgi:hypothetical protein